jgi:uroporphyrinogen-III synthase
MSLRHQVVAITRPISQANQLADLIKNFEGIPYLAPTIELKPYQNNRKILKILKRIFKKEIHYLIFKSVNGVDYFFKYLQFLSLKENFLKKLNNSIIIAIGPKTRAELNKNGIEATVIPNKYSSEGIIEILKKKNLIGKVIVIPGVKRFRNKLTKELRSFGAKVFTIPVYEITLPKNTFKILTLIRDIINGKINIITFTSSHTALNLINIARSYKLDHTLKNALNKCVIAVIGPVTQKTLGNFGVKTNIIPKDYTIEAMVNSIINFLSLE